MRNNRMLLEDLDFVKFINNLYERYQQGIITYHEYLKRAYK